MLIESYLVPEFVFCILIFENFFWVPLLETLGPDQSQETELWFSGRCYLL